MLKFLNLRTMMRFLRLVFAGFSVNWVLNNLAHVLLLSVGVSLNGVILCFLWVVQTFNDLP